MSEPLAPEIRPRLAHSARASDGREDPYPRHILAVHREADRKAAVMLRYASDPPAQFRPCVNAAAVFHDLGKLDPDNQRGLACGRTGRMPWDHIDAGVAHMLAKSNAPAQWMIRGHHAPGFPSKAAHDSTRRLRGRRRDDWPDAEHERQIKRTDENLAEYLCMHESDIGPFEVSPAKSMHGLSLRLALSCLVDADHEDTAYFDTGHLRVDPPAPRWNERLESLEQYVGGLGTGTTEREVERNLRRAAVFKACVDSPLRRSMVTCEASVGLGKTTAVCGYLLRRCVEEDLRRLIIVVPFTNILTQMADVFRKALVLPDEHGRESEIIVEHHHRADFASRDERDLAVLWTAPVVLTTAVSFFETLAACDPGSLRKLHSVPGSAIFIDEAHAAIPAALWPQNWKWLAELASTWSCPVVFSSGSLARFWTSPKIVTPTIELPDLLPPDLRTDVLDAERKRILYRSVRDGRVVTIDALVDAVQHTDGPQLVILNTVQNAAVVAAALASHGHKVIHLSTALTPRDRAAAFDRVRERLKSGSTDWALVATSCVEAGVDLSFRTAFRERFSVASILQTAGRASRHGEHEECIVYDFALDDRMTTNHPAARMSAPILANYMREDWLNEHSAAELVTRALIEEIAASNTSVNALEKAEKQRNYPEVARLGKVIDTDTRIVVIEPELKAALRARSHPPIRFRELLSGSVQIFARKIEMLPVSPIHRDLYAWNGSYDSAGLGYMTEVLRLKTFFENGGGII